MEDLMFEIIRSQVGSDEQVHFAKSMAMMLAVVDGSELK